MSNAHSIVILHKNYIFLINLFYFDASRGRLSEISDFRAHGLKNRKFTKTPPMGVVNK